MRASLLVVVRASGPGGQHHRRFGRRFCATPPAPIIEVVATSFIQESSLEAVHVDDGAQIEYTPGPNGIEQTFIDAFTDLADPDRKYPEPAR